MHGLHLELSGGESARTDARVWMKRTTTESRTTKMLQQREAKDPKMTMFAALYKKQNKNKKPLPHDTHLRIFIFSRGDLHDCHSKDSKDSKLKIKLISACFALCLQPVAKLSLFTALLSKCCFKAMQVKWKTHIFYLSKVKQTRLLTVNFLQRLARRRSQGGINIWLLVLSLISVRCHLYIWGMQMEGSNGLSSFLRRNYLG